MEFIVKIDIISLRKALILFYRKRLTINLVIEAYIFFNGIGTIVVSQFNRNLPTYFGIMFLLFGLINIFFTIKKVNKTIDLSIKQMQQRYDGNSCEYLYTFSEVSVSNKNLKDGNVFSIKYCHLLKCIESNDIILLKTNLKQFIFIPKNSLDNLDCEKIINLIKNKNIPHKRVK